VQPDNQTVAFLSNIYSSNNWKVWAALVTVILAIYRGFHWVRGIRDEDLKETNTGLKELAVESKAQTIGLAGLKEELQSQTSAVVSELKELRNDFRTLHIYTQPQMVPVRARAPRAPRKPASKPAEKPKASSKVSVKSKAKAQPKTKTRK
jgi:Cu/Zn superoxide dismutase